MARLLHLLGLSFLVTLVSTVSSSASDSPSVFSSAQGSHAKLLEAHRGKVLLLVNTASQCGFTEQYRDLQAVYERFKDRGFAVIAFPSNDFGGQEPGSDKEIKTFCTLRFGVTFPLAPKSVVAGPLTSALFQYLTAEGPTDLRGPIQWNFEKFLIDRHGRLVSRFGSFTTPDNPDLIDAIEKAL